MAPHPCSGYSFASLPPSSLLWPSFCSLPLLLNRAVSFPLRIQPGLQVLASCHIYNKSSGNQHFPGSFVLLMISWEVGSRGGTSPLPCPPAPRQVPPTVSVPSSWTQVPVFMTSFCPHAYRTYPHAPTPHIKCNFCCKKWKAFLQVAFWNRLLSYSFKFDWLWFLRSHSVTCSWKGRNLTYQLFSHRIKYLWILDLIIKDINIIYMLIFVFFSLYSGDSNLF